jgi:benzoate/toluate 1,2-dioxygenase beta subunit
MERPDLRAVEEFLFHEAELLDTRQYDAWKDLFTESGYYWVPSQHDQKDPFTTVSLFYDDRPMMEARVLRLKHPSNLLSGPAFHYHHHVGNVRVRGPHTETGGWIVTSYVLMVESRPDEQRTYSAACEYSLLPRAESFAIAYKKAVLVNCDRGFGALNVPF